MTAGNAHRGRCVLLLTHAGDEYVPERVAAAVARRGGEAVRVDTDRYPVVLSVRTAVSVDGRDDRMLLPDGRAILGRDVGGVWLRRPRPPALDDVPEPLRAHARRESLAALLDGALSLPGATIIDHPEAIAAFEGRKLRQLTRAAALGLAVPRTLVTNDPDEARQFIGGADPSRFVCKLLTQPEDRTVHTQALAAADLDELDGLRRCPMVFQERVEKARELRVMMVDGRPFAGAVIAPGIDDWRAAGRDDVTRTAAGSPWHPASLPEDVAARAAALLRSVGLRTGAFDFIETPRGEHVFLEVNPAGEWGMLERDLGLPISDALAEALLSPVPA